MTEPTRRAVLTALGALTAAGCLGRPVPGTPTENPPIDSTPSPDDTATSGGFTPGVDVPKADHAVFLGNQGDRARTVRVTVIREATGEVVFEEIRTVDPGTEREIYNLRQADPSGIEAFRICGQLADATPTADPDATETTVTNNSSSPNCITMQTNACYGTAHVSVSAAGDLDVIYSIC